LLSRKPEKFIDVFQCDILKLVMGAKCINNLHEPWIIPQIFLAKLSKPILLLVSPKHLVNKSIITLIAS